MPNSALLHEPGLLDHLCLYVVDGLDLERGVLDQALGEGGLRFELGQTYRSPGSLRVDSDLNGTFGSIQEVLLKSEQLRFTWKRHSHD